MSRHRYVHSVVVGLLCGISVALIVIAQFYPYDQEFNAAVSYRVPKTHASGLSSEFGIVGAVPSLSSDSGKSAAVAKMTDAGFGWVRYEFTYSASVDFGPFDAANAKLKASGVKTLGLLAYPGSDKTHDDWKTFVNSVVGHYGSDIAAWEIMNEADNYLSGSEYASYLKEAKDIIKGINSGATIVAAGLTSRAEATNFWDALAGAGGWGDFDMIGLHVYHNGNPEKVNFGGGDLVAELDRVAGNINKNGGGKKIWITEMGYESGSVGADNQANWLARSLVMLRSVSKLDKIFIYKLYDGSGDSYGLLNSSLATKTSFDRVKSTIQALSGKGFGSKLTPQQKTSLDAFDSVSGWKTTASSNAGVTLGSGSGYSGNGMDISYNFSQDSAYAIAEKEIAISGTPTGFAAWIYGDDTKNVWKFRFKDSQGETFQTDLGSISAGWQYKQFTIGTDTAFTSWGGNGTIDFPVKFNSFVIDRQGGAATGSGKVDSLIAITGSADLYAYQFGSTVAYWKASGSDTATLCGASRSFTEEPQYAGNVDCSDTPASTSSSSSSSSTTKKKTTTTTAPKAAAPKVSIDKTKSYVRLDGKDILADGKQTYHIVVGVKDAAGNTLTDRKPEILMSGGQTTLTDSILIGGEWIAEVSSTEVGERKALVKVDGQELTTLSLSFIALPVAATPLPQEKVQPETAAVTAPEDSNSAPAAKVIGGGLIGLLVIGVGVAIWYFRLQKAAGL